ncbi:hypothetical protein [Kaistella yonginensis]|uniref:hypothetical protein n=1 Tax=Kaistella yonginensis TaxID=658267 RepID=UPI0025B3DC84|nr:hypothetical protein [Kaistella yonginensis]MDN3607263.1 hypothetical protein [Kaistella yonginensis]
MIYLIDDNQNNQRKKNYNLTYIEDGEFEEILTSVERLEIGNSLTDISHLKFLDNADCILLHTTTEDYDKKKGFLSGSKNNVIKIKELISEEGEKIPLVLFSNSMVETVFDFKSNPNFISSISKNVHYENLFDFLQYYKITGNVELRIIAWGKNFESKEISKLAIDILNSIELKENSELLKLGDLSKTIYSFKSFVGLALPKYDINDILNEIEDHPMKIQDFKKKINQITESFIRYGKNIHSWK